MDLKEAIEVLKENYQKEEGKLKEALAEAIELMEYEIHKDDPIVSKPRKVIHIQARMCNKGRKIPNKFEFDY